MNNKDDAGAQSRAKHVAFTHSPFSIPHSPPQRHRPPAGAYQSTRGNSPRVTLSEAIAAGLAPDGGLYVPHALPPIDPHTFDPHGTLADTAAALLAPFFAGDVLADALPAMCREALDFPTPMQPLGTGNDQVLELFHGPTAAFKDIGARFLAACLTRLPRADGRTLTILVATSGDTGAAVGAAFHKKSGVRVVILYPDGRVSPRQAHQLGCFGDNVHTLRVAGRFDDCQRMVKVALADAELQRDVPLSSANSISLGRLLPQMSYYAHVALAHWRATGEAMNFIIPTGNLGNAMACLWVRQCGLPIGAVEVACNANETLPAFLHGGDYQPRDAIPTLANAMDVGAPNNVERLRWTYADDATVRRQLRAASISDAQIQATIRRYAHNAGAVLCPHTATAAARLDQLREHGDTRAWTVVATAHPAKFEQVVEPLIGKPLAIPPPLAAMLEKSAQAQPLDTDEAALRAWLRAM